MGIEPTSKAWEALVLPMNYARASVTLDPAVALQRFDNSNVIAAFIRNASALLAS